MLRCEVLFVSPAVYSCLALARVPLPGVGKGLPPFRPFFYVNVTDIHTLETELSYVACKNAGNIHYFLKVLNIVHANCCSCPLDVKVQPKGFSRRRSTSLMCTWTIRPCRHTGRACSHCFGSPVLTERSTINSRKRGMMPCSSNFCSSQSQ